MSRVTYLPTMMTFVTVKLGQALDIAAQKMCLVHRYMTK